jgi:hypothetical protein
VYRATSRAQQARGTSRGRNRLASCLLAYKISRPPSPQAVLSVEERKVGSGRSPSRSELRTRREKRLARGGDERDAGLSFAAGLSLTAAPAHTGHGGEDCPLLRLEGSGRRSSPAGGPLHAGVERVTRACVAVLKFRKSRHEPAKM